MATVLEEKVICVGGKSLIFWLNVFPKLTALPTIGVSKNYSQTVLILVQYTRINHGILCSWKCVCTLYCVDYDNVAIDLSSTNWDKIYLHQDIVFRKSYKKDASILIYNQSYALFKFKYIINRL